MFSFLFGSSVITSEQKLEAALKEKQTLDEQINQLTAALNSKNLEISKIKDEIKSNEVATSSDSASIQGIPVTAVLTQKSTGNVVSDFALYFRPDMSPEEHNQVMKKIREERQFRINLLPPAEVVQTGFAAVMSELVKKLTN